MGWWRINDTAGGIGRKPSGEKSGLANAIPGTHSAEDSFNGDEPASAFDAALREVVAAYEGAWGRPPAEEELRAAFEFVLRGHLEDDDA